MTVADNALLDLKIIGGTIVDGSGKTRYRADVGVKDGRIVAIGSVPMQARQTIDAAGKIVAPGFVDIHTHYDAQVCWDPTLSPSSFHGVTTVFAGFCGFSIAPLSEESGAYLLPMLARVEGMPIETLRAGASWDWSSFGDYLGRLDGKLAINAGFMAGHSTIRRYVMGPRAVGNPASRAEIDQMKTVLREAISDGAMGLSTSLSQTHHDGDGNPVPSRSASREEVLELFSVVSEFEGTCAEMLPGVKFTDEVYELLTQTSLAAKRPVNWNVVVLMQGDAQESAEIERKLGASDYARERGATIVGLTPPMTPCFRTNLDCGVGFISLKGWQPLFLVPIPERMAMLRDPERRAQLKADAATVTGIQAPIRQWDRMRILDVYSEENQKYAGRVIGEIAAEEGRDAFDVFLDVSLADDLRTGIILIPPEETEEIYRLRAKLWDDPRALIGASDAGAHVDNTDSFSIPTSLLSSAVRDHKVITLERAVHYLTQKPAELMGVKERGLIKQGWHADIVIFDADTVGTGKTYMRHDLPAGGARLYADAVGIHHVIVNGQEIMRDGEYLGVTAGSVLRSGKDTYTVTIPAAA